jgi:hypothetical protein
MQPTRSACGRRRILTRAAAAAASSFFLSLYMLLALSDKSENLLRLTRESHVMKGISCNLCKECAGCQFLLAVARRPAGESTLCVRPDAFCKFLRKQHNYLYEFQVLYSHCLAK